jgi:hypothetical protein
MTEAIHKVGANIEKGGIPASCHPLVFAVIGTGRVSQGVLEVLEKLPHVKVEPDNLEKYFETCKNDPSKQKEIVISVFSAKDLVEPIHES